MLVLHTGVLGDSSGNCKPVTLAGTYSPGIALTSANTVQVQVTVATAGTYSIKTNTVNGVTFSKTGTFTSTGTQNVILNGSGTPANSGDQNFTLSYGNSQCSFTINFVSTGFRYTWRRWRKLYSFCNCRNLSTGNCS